MLRGCLTAKILGFAPDASAVSADDPGGDGRTSGWTECDIIIVTGDAYVDHPSFGMAIVGRVLEAQGFRVGIIAQPDWRSTDAFQELGTAKKLFYGITAGNMDSMVNRYTSDRKIRRDDAYTPEGEPGKRPDRSAIVYAQRAREAYPAVPIVLGGIEASLRRVAHYDYWSEKVRRSVLMDSKADVLLFGNAERAICEVAHRLAADESVSDITDVRGTVFLRDRVPDGWTEIDSTHLDTPGKLEPRPDPYAMEPEAEDGPGCDLPAASSGPVVVRFERHARNAPRETTVIRLPSFESVRDDPVLEAHASRLLHLESNPGNARALVQRHGNKDVVEPTSDTARNAGDGPTLRAAIPASTTSPLRRCPYSRVSHDSIFSGHSARLFWRLYVLLYHRT